MYALIYLTWSRDLDAILNCVVIQAPDVPETGTSKILCSQGYSYVAENFSTIKYFRKGLTVVSR